jgi:hypothetical protein
MLSADVYIPSSLPFPAESSCDRSLDHLRNLEQKREQYKPTADNLRGQLTTWPAIRKFMFAGNARFTLRSLKTGMRYTYQVRVSKQDLKDLAKKDDPAYFVSLLRGSDNVKDYKYLGCLHGARFFITAASRLPRTSPSVQALLWFLDAMEKQKDVLGSAIEFWHEGRCCHCGRTLTVPKSIKDAAFNGGYGPECAKYFGGAQ